MLETELQAEKVNHEKAISQLSNECAILKNQQSEEQNPEKTEILISKLNSLEVRKWYFECSGRKKKSPTIHLFLNLGRQ